MSQAYDNSQAGKTFEEAVLTRARFNGLFAEKNPVSAKYTYNGRLIALESELDYKFITPEGQCGYFDCKNFDSDKFSYSSISEHQLGRSLVYSEWNVPSGFIIYFKPKGKVVFFLGRHIADKGPRNSFSWEEGLLLGDLQSFDLRPIMKEK